MNDFDDFFKPENKFVVPVSFQLLPEDEIRLRKFINLHYLGDEDANELVDGLFVPKYPEKELGTNMSQSGCQFMAFALSQ